jgi:hypothetical protein
MNCFFFLFFFLFSYIYLFDFRASRKLYLWTRRNYLKYENIVCEIEKEGDGVGANRKSFKVQSEIKVNAYGIQIK